MVPTRDPTTKTLRHNEFFNNKSYYYLKPTDIPALRFYGEPKVYKPEVRICRIVSYRGYPLYNLNKYIANTLKDENNITKNSTTFSNYIRNVPIEDDEVMVSFDDISLYMNISIIKTLNTVKDYVYNNDLFMIKMASLNAKFLF